MSVVASIKISGQCGFPGRPLNGRVFIEEDSWGTGRGASNSSKTTDSPYVANNSTDDSHVSNSTEQNRRFTEEINETTWNNEELHRVVYRCDHDSLTGGDDGNEYYRDCVDGQWTGQIPLCGTFRLFILIPWA